MKTILKKLCLLICAAMMCSFASAAGKSSKKKASPEYTLEKTHDMDANWDMYFETGDETYLENVLAYADSEDLMMTKINKQAKTLMKDENFVKAMEHLGAEVNGNKFDLAYDLELMVSFFVQDEEFADATKYVYSFFPDEMFIRGVVKSTSFWSLVSNASQHEEINIAIQKRLPYLNEKAHMTFVLGLGLNEKIPLLKSDKGSAEYSNDKIYLMPVLINDLDRTVNDWNSLDAEEMPSVKPSSEVNLKKEINSIAPFIMYSANAAMDYPIYYDGELIKPDGTTSAFKATKVNLATKAPQNSTYIYAAQQQFNWVFDKTDAPGKYTLRLSVYTSKQVIAVFEMDFKLKK